MTSRCLARAALAASLLALAACALNPVTGHPQVVLISRAGEQEIGAEQAEKVKAGLGLVADGPLVEYVKAVGAKLAAQSPRKDVQYTFAVVDTPADA